MSQRPAKVLQRQKSYTGSCQWFIHFILLLFVLCLETNKQLWKIIGCPENIFPRIRIFMANSKKVICWIPDSKTFVGLLLYNFWVFTSWYTSLVCHLKTKHRESASFQRLIAQFQLNNLLCFFSHSSGKFLGMTRLVCHVVPNFGRGRSVNKIWHKCMPWFYIWFMMKYKLMTFPKKIQHYTLCLFTISIQTFAN